MGHDYKNIPWYSHFPPLLLVNASLGYEENSVSGSTFNPYEAAVVRAIVAKLRGLISTFQQSEVEGRDTTTASLRIVTVGILTPYNAQVEMLANLDSSNSLHTSNKNCLKISVTTVDGCQGQEYDIVIFSAVRANDNGRVGFLRDARRLNVAVTRPKHTLIVVCHTKTVSTDDCWLSLIEQFSINAIDSDIWEITQKANKRYSETLDKQLNQTRFDNYDWKISFSESFKVSLARIPIQQCKHIVAVLVKIANGERPNGERNICNGFIHHWDVQSFSVVWSVDVCRSSYTRKCVQVVKVWDLVDRKNVQLSLKIVCRATALYTQEYKKYCQQESLNTDNKKRKPVHWPYDDEMIWTMDPKELMNIQSITSSLESNVSCLKFYELSSNVAKLLLKSSSEQLKSTFPFELNDIEEKVVCGDSSILLLGRSGRCYPLLLSTTRSSLHLDLASNTCLVVQALERLQRCSIGCYGRN